LCSASKAKEALRAMTHHEKKLRMSWSETVPTAFGKTCILRTQF
jgi:hypothetical protein